MVFCNYISNTQNTVTYAFGGDINHINGVFVFDFVNSKLVIEKEPDEYMAPIPHIHRVIRRNHGDFRKGIFKTKISYES